MAGIKYDKCHCELWKCHPLVNYYWQSLYKLIIIIIVIISLMSVSILAWVGQFPEK